MQARLFANLIREGTWLEARIDRAIPDRQPLPKPDIRRMMQPLGPVVIFGASNFPFAISVAGTDTVSALGAGCPVVVKAHPGHPGTCEMIGTVITEAARKTGMPPGVFSLLQGKGNYIGMALAKHSLTAAVAFTGSLRGGRALFDACTSRPRPIPFYGELGSVNPVSSCRVPSGNVPPPWPKPTSPRLPWAWVSSAQTRASSSASRARNSALSWTRPLSL
jgi:alpha-ketoglutaric semialdehyde dehydrogenase